MPTMRKDRGNAWLARVIIGGKTMDTKFFPPGRPKGPEWMAARRWEIDRKKELLEAQRNNIQTLSGLELLFSWGERYLTYVERSMGRKTFAEKRTVMTHFFGYCQRQGITNLERISKPAFIQWLSEVYDERGPDRANRYRKNLLAAWNWGIDAVEGFPQSAPILERIKPFPVDAGERYVPPEEDVIKVLKVATGQDLVMLLTFYYTGARRGEVFRLTWADVDLEKGKIRLTDHKGGSGKKRVRWLPTHPVLIDALKWWQEERPCKTDHVFMQLQNDSALGLPFTERNKLMPVLCKRAGVKPFGFHALRHKAASIAFMSGGLNAAQQLMGHSRATTTDIYIRSAGLYDDKNIILDALGESGIGQAASELLKKEMPQRGRAVEAFCNQSLVTKKALN